ncbi:LysR family transcriptional regulator [Marinomonas piezotolerans]|uniref:LysR family transcriptional regulator n=1 Tax=Marinomonas piezotolerans TaxID=2213058 RepID=A0A370U9P2_9GAMM|nr:LysR family transcriptional regulator [Marinomonas piezotolerans]RDL44485.1 LysR family transcriptional regulator [Marinomonas piezotolerans]
MNDQFELRDLIYFQRVATLGHVGKAAEQLHKTQPALTGAIRRIERALDTRLFEKDGRNIQLTTAGELLLQRSHTILGTVHDVALEIKELESGVKGQVKLGLVPTAAHHILLPIVNILTQDFPSIKLKTTIGQTDLLYDKLKERELDLVIGLNGDLDPDFKWVPFYQDTMVVVANSSHDVFKGKINLSHLVNFKWVLAPTSVMSRQWLDRTFEMHGLTKPDVQIETNLLLMIPSVIMKTELLSFISRRNLEGVDTSKKHLKEVPIPELCMERHYNVISRKEGYLSPAATCLRDIFIQQGRRIFDGS